MHSNAVMMMKNGTCGPTFPFMAFNEKIDSDQTFSTTRASALLFIKIPKEKCEIKNIYREN